MTFPIDTKAKAFVYGHPSFCVRHGYGCGVRCSYYLDGQKETEVPQIEGRVGTRRASYLISIHTQSDHVRSMLNPSDQRFCYVTYRCVTLAQALTNL